MKRQDGYYWVLIVTGWRIAEWKKDCWYLVGGGNTFQDRDFAYINENKIIR